jgi:protein-tyrosine phosphatase
MALTDRRIPLTAGFNFRDLGGIATADGRHVRSGVLYRADALHRLTDDDLDVLRRLGLRTVIDLRTQGEIDRHGRIVLADRDEVVHYHLSMFDQVWSPEDVPGDDEAPTSDEVGEGYLRMLESGGPAVATAIRLLADGETLPAVFHCTAGKDRTGVLAALVLGQLGVADEAIAEDYALTELAVEGTRAWLRRNDPDSLGRLPAWVWRAPAAAMQAFLAQVRAEHGSIPGLLAHLGVSQATLDALEATLLDP